MSNKKRIRKLLLKKYKPSKKFNLPDRYLIIGYGRIFGITHQINKITQEYLDSLKNDTQEYFRKNYCNDPIIKNDICDAYKMYIETFPLAFPK